MNEMTMNSMQTSNTAAPAPSQDGNILTAEIRTKVRDILRSNEQDGSVYKLVLADLEIPLLETVMRFTRNNQSEAARILGLSRGTLRKKLKQYFGSCYITYK